jgi:PKD repeat protein
MISTLRSPVTALRRHLKTRTRGQSLVELALILPVFMLFFAAILDLGRIAAAQVAVENAAREGAFQAADTPTDFDSTTGCPAGGATNKVYCRIKLESSGGVTINPSDVSVVCNPVDCSTGIGNTVTVRVTGHFRLLTPLMGVFFAGNQNVTFAAQSVHNRETLPTTGTNPVATPTPTPTPTSTSTATPTPTPTLPPTCQIPSAGFTQVVTGSPSNKAPQTVTVTDTSSSLNCGITSWIWAWGDGTTSSGKVPGSHTYVAPNPDKSGYFIVKLTVTNAAGNSTVGGVQIQVK